MSDILKEICDNRQKKVNDEKIKMSLNDIKAKLFDIEHKPSKFISSLENKKTGKYSLIAELKKASPSAGLIRPNFDVIDIANSYIKAGAKCLSILTETDYFQGDNQYLINVKEKFDIPVIRKDFIIDEYQIYQSKLINADAILLIVGALTNQQLTEYEAIAHEIGLDVLVEVHDEDELKRAIDCCKSRLFGINNRNLKTMNTDIKTSVNLAKMMPENKIIVSESGLKTYEDLEYMEKHNITTFLIGEHLMKQDNIYNATTKILHNT